MDLSAVNSRPFAVKKPQLRCPDIDGGKGSDLSFPPLTSVQHKGLHKGLLTAAAKTGQLTLVFVELFHHEDDALEGLRKTIEGHGVDTTDGRSYGEAVVDGLADVARRLNNLRARGIL